MRTNELSVGKVLVATDSAELLKGLSFASKDNPSGVLGEATASAQASSSAAVKADASIGSGTILAGQTQVFVTSNSKIFLTAETSIAQTLAVTQKTAGIGFMVELKSVEKQDVLFSWWIIN